jgi:SAM-dependent methyltransferase
MSDMNRSFAGSMPEFYDRILVPVMFEPFALDLTERLRGITTGQVLELAAGTGVVTRALARLLPGEVAITASDLNPAMLDRAKSHTGLERVQWREADALALPFGDRQFDYVLCQFGVMFFPDKRAAFREAWRLLRPGGRFMFNVWGDREGSPFDLAATVAGEFLGRDPASLVSPPYNGVGVVQADLTAAGFSAINRETVTKVIRSASARDAAMTMTHGGMIRAAIEAQMPGRLAEITEATAAAIEARFGSGPVEAPLRALLFTAVRASE